MCKKEMNEGERHIHTKLDRDSREIKLTTVSFSSDINY